MSQSTALELRAARESSILRGVRDPGRPTGVRGPVLALSKAMNRRLQPVIDRSLLSPALALLALGALLLSQGGCANENSLVDVGFSRSTSPDTDDTNPDGGGGDTPDNPDDNPDDPDNPDDTPDNPDDPPDGGEETPPNAPELSCGMFVIRDLRISSDSGDDIDFRPWADLDLANPNGSTLNDLGVSAGLYNRVRFTTHKRTGDGSDGPGTGNPEVNHSAHLCGTYQGVTWDYTDDTTEHVDRRDEGGVQLDGEGPAKLFVVFDSTTWFDGIDLTQATVAADGVVYLAHHENADLQHALRDNIRESIHLANHPPH